MLSPVNEFIQFAQEGGKKRRGTKAKGRKSRKSRKSRKGTRKRRRH